MQQEINLPILVLLFAVSLLCIPDQNSVTASFTAQAVNGNELETFHATATLQKSPEGTLNGSGHLAPATDAEQQIPFTITENQISITLPDGTTFQEQLEPFAQVKNTSDYMQRAGTVFFNNRGLRTVSQQFPGYAMQTLHAGRGGLVQIIESQNDAGITFPRTALWKVDPGIGVHITLDSISFTATTEKAETE